MMEICKEVVDQTVKELRAGCFERVSIPEDIECDQFTKHDGGRRCAAYVYRIHVIADAQMLQNQSRYVYVLNVTKGSMKEISIWKV